MAEAKAQAQAAKDTGVQHVIWSTLEDTRKWVPLSDNRMPTLMGKYKVPHFDGKGEADDEFTKLGVPTTFLLTSFYWDNLIHFGMGPKKGPDGKLAFTLPMDDKKLPGIAAEDIGKCASASSRRAREYHRQDRRHRRRASDRLRRWPPRSPRRWGKQCVYNAVTPEVYRGFGFPGADDLGNMFQFKRDFESVFCGARNLDVSRSLNPALQTFEQWLSQNKSRIPLG